MTMKITDIDGCELTITNLDNAIEQAAYFKDCHHIPPIASDKRRKAYWRDIYQKLLILKSKQNEQPRR
jgi:hypothetical protein